MKFKSIIAVVTAALAASETATFAHQKAVSSAIEPPAVWQQLGQVEFITPQELKVKVEQGEPVIFVDLRSSISYAQSDQKIKGAIHTKVRKVAYRLRNVPRDREIVTYCSCPADESAAMAARELLAKGYKRVKVLKGGWIGWLQAGGPVEPKPRL